jgi:hypothetical protein
MNNIDPKTNGHRRQTINDLYKRTRDAIDATYLTGERRPNGSQVTRDTDEARAIRDYVRNQSWLDKFEDLVTREKIHERKHRKFAPAGYQHQLSVEHAALIILLDNIGDGARLPAAPSASSALILRDTAAEAIVVGWCARDALRASPGLLEDLAKLDYAAAVNPERAQRSA